MDPITKSFPASFKALGPDDGEPVGTFEAMVAVFDNVDKAGDRINSKAFDTTLKAWQESGDPIPVILSHNWDDPFAIIGHADPANVKAIENRGLYVKGTIDHLDQNPVAAQVHRLMQGRVLKEFSFGYTVPKGGEKKAKDGAYDLTEINLIEVGPTLKGVNPDTELLSMKSAIQAHNRRKSYVDVDVPGSFEAIQDSLRAALGESYPQPADYKNGYVSVNLVATTGTEVTYQVCTYSDGEKSDVMYSAPYEIDAEGVATLGEATEVEAQIVEKADLYEELVKLAVEYKALDQLEAEAWAKSMVEEQFTAADPEPEPEAKSDEPEPDPEPEPEVKSEDVNSEISKLRLEQAEHEVGKALSAEALEAAALSRQLAVELEQFEQ